MKKPSGMYHAARIPNQLHPRAIHFGDLVRNSKAITLVTVVVAEACLRREISIGAV